MPTAIEAMNAVTTHLLSGDIVAAQTAVLVIEQDGSVLPSSTFERVLRIAVKADCLTPEYRRFCEGAYGRQQFATILASIG